MKQRLLVASFLVISSLVIFSCKKDNSQSTFRVRMTDAPAAYDSVNIDLKEVEVKFAKDTNSWVTMQTTPGIYNLLGFQNGIDTLIAQGTYPADQVVKEIRLVVGNNNTIVVGGVSYPLTIPSGEESGLKIKVNKKLQATLETIVIDFDAALSISQEADGYKLKPVIKLK